MSKIRVEQREPRGLAVDESEQHLKPPLGPEPMTAQIIFGGNDGVGRLVVGSQLSDQPQEQTNMTSPEVAKGTGWRHPVLFGRSALCRSGYRYGRGGRC